MAIAPYELDAKRALDVLLECEGSLGEACEVLGTPANPILKSDLVKALAKDPAELQRAIRVLTMLEAHDLRSKVKLVVHSTLDKLDPEEAVKAYTQLSEQVEKLTQAPNKNSTNVLQLIFDNLPREAASAVKGLSRLDSSQLDKLRQEARAKASQQSELVTEPDDMERASAAQIVASFGPDENGL
jgi:hypothetical protein